MKKYHIGYTAGVFDLFHIGHLNLLKRAKERCDYLMVGVLTDELVIHFKGHGPYIPTNERIAIIEAIKYVDEVVPVTFDNIKKKSAWELYHFDCLFSGDDWKDHPAWIADKKVLNELGSNIEFFSYTEETSTTMIREKIQEG